MRYSSEEYAIITIESSFFKDTRNMKHIERWLGYNFASFNIKIINDYIPPFSLLNEIFPQENVNIEFEAISETIQDKLNYSSMSLHLRYSEILSLFASNSQKLILDRYQFTILDVCLSESYDWKVIEQFSDLFASFVVLNPYFENSNIDLTNYSSFLNLVFDSSCENMRLSNNHIHVNSLRVHPCHIGACNAKTCHMNKSGLPKNIYINQEGDVLLFSEFHLGNVRDKSLDNILIFYQNEYLDINRLIFSEEILGYSYQFFPWREYFISYWRQSHAK